MLCHFSRVGYLLTLCNVSYLLYVVRIDIFFVVVSC